MFQVNDHVFYGVNGVCVIDDVCTEPFEGAPKDVLYYVLHTISEPRQIIFNPVNNEKVPMRHVMTKDDAASFFSLLPTLSPLAGNSAKELRDAYIRSIKSGDPTEWGRVMCTYRTRLRLADAKLTRVTDAERGFHESARRMLAAEIGLALCFPPPDVEKQLEAALS